MTNIRFDKLKEVLFYTALMVPIILSGLLLAVAFSDYYHAKKTVDSIKEAQK